MQLNSFLWLGATILSTGAAFARATLISQTSFTNTIRLLFDVDGNQIDAYGSKINYFNGKYYLYGNSFSTTGIAYGVKSYSSNDLTNWAYEGFLYDQDGLTPCSGSGGCGRPHIIYHEKSQKYILWTNAGSNGYPIATSSSPSKGFIFSPSAASIDPSFAHLQPADFAVENFGNGEAYIVFSALNFLYPEAGDIWPPLQQTLHIQQLSDDFMNTTGVSYNVTSSDFDLVDQETESPDIFKRNGVYYVAASNTCGYCNGTLALLYRSNSIQGPWDRQILSGNSCEGQIEAVLPLINSQSNQTTYLWHSTSVPGGPRTGFGGHIFQDLQFESDGSVQDLDCSNSAQFPVQFDLGTGAPSSGDQVAANRTTIGSPIGVAYTPVCDSDQFTLIQTWIQPVAGTITGLSINIASSVQTTALKINAFKFSNLSELISPGYKYQSLGTSSVLPANLSYTFDTTFVALNASVSAGDHVGFSIAGPDFAPYCHLEYDLGDNDTMGMVLLQQGQGQNSYRGANGRASPVYLREGKGVRFFVSMQ